MQAQAACQVACWFLSSVWVPSKAWCPGDETIKTTFSHSYPPEPPSPPLLSHCETSQPVTARVKTADRGQSPRYVQVSSMRAADPRAHDIVMQGGAGWQRWDGRGFSKATTTACPVACRHETGSRQGVRVVGHCPCARPCGRQTVSGLDTPGRLDPGYACKTLVLRVRDA